MKLFCAYAFTGEDAETLAARMKMIVDTLEAKGHDVYCNLFDPVVDGLQQNDDVKGICLGAFKHIDTCDALVAVITSPYRSLGQSMEIGVALSQHKPVYLFEHTSAAGSSYLPRLVDKHVAWTSSEELKEALSGLEA